MIEVAVRKKLTMATGEAELQVAFSLEKGTFTTLFGPSGAGKTTLLKMLAGLVRPERGFIRVGTETWVDTEQKRWMPPQQRSVGLVFQDYALFPNLTVRENLAFGLRDRHNQALVAEMLALTGLTGLSNRYPGTLSGGQQQRVALARTLVRQPQVLLLDEPFAALDTQTKSILRTELLRLHGQLGLTTILVSHDPAEIYQLSDYVLELDHGQLVRQGKTRALFGTQELSAKLVLYGQVIRIIPSDIVYIIEIQLGQQLVRVIATHQEAKYLRVGDTVRVTTKVFNPIISKVN